MGGQQSSDILKKSPLGCILAHWKDIGGPPGGSVNKKTLIKYCNQWWPLYKLEDDEKWPFNGSLNYNTILQLMLFPRKELKWDEVMYADTFFTLRNHPEWQKNCDINIPPQNPLVLCLEKEKRNGRKEQEKIKRCCSACSIGQRCLKVTSARKEKEEAKDQFEDLGLSPPLQNLPPPLPSLLSRTDSSSEEEGETNKFTPITTRPRVRLRRLHNSWPHCGR